MFYLSHYDYKLSQKISAQGHSFYGLLAALFRGADTDNLERLDSAFPGFLEMLQQRYNAPGGVLPEVDGFTVEDLEGVPPGQKENPCT